LDVVSEYGAVLEKAQMNWTGLHDVSVLPFDKARIKAAILDVANDFRDYPEQIESLGAGFVMLGSFQSLNSTIMTWPKSKEVEVMEDDDLIKHAKKLFERNEDLSDAAIAADESSELLAEWKAHLKMLGIDNA